MNEMNITIQIKLKPNSLLDLVDIFVRLFNHIIRAGQNITIGTSAVVSTSEINTELVKANMTVIVT